MKSITRFWQVIRQIDEQAGAVNPWFNLANESFDMVMARHQRDWKQITRRFRRPGKTG